MTTSENNQEIEEVCIESNLPKEECQCSECSPIVIDIYSPLLEARNVNELAEKLSDIRAIVECLRTGGFGITLDSDRQYIKVHPPLIDGCYWMQCRGCGYPIIIEKGEEPEMFCESCSRIVLSRSTDHPRYYDDLFMYIDLNLKNHRIPPDYDSDLPLTEEFCEAHALDFEVIKARLNHTGGYDPGEVMMNSMWTIPWFDKLPMKMQKGG
jgi:hypothetical protein